MKIKCVDTRQAQSDLETAVKLGRKNAGLFGYTEIVNDNGELFINYRSGTGFHGLTARYKIVFEDNYIVMKPDRSLINLWAECFILIVPVVLLLLLFGEFIFNIIFAQKVTFDFAKVLLSLWIIGVIKIGPMHYIKKYVKSIVVCEEERVK